MRMSRLNFGGALVFLCVLMSFRGFAETGAQQESAVVQRVMASALSRCYSSVNGVTKISFEAPTDQEFAEIAALGVRAISPLAEYFDLEPKAGFAQLFAVKFLMTIKDPQTFNPLKRAFAQDQWEVVRAAALAGMFRISRTETLPYIASALNDKSEVVRRRAKELLILSQQQGGLSNVDR